MAFFMEKERTTSTPYVLVDEAKNYMKFEGYCFHEEVMELFADVNDWLDNYLAADFGTFTFDCALEYFNSSTTKLLRNMLIRMDKHVTEKNKIIVNWITTEDNEIICECYEDFSEEVKHLEFNLVLN